MVVSVYIDGSSNSMDSCICIIIKGGNIRKGLRKQVQTHERVSSYAVEYLALIKALEFLKEWNFSKKEEKIIYTDSLQVVNEINMIRPCSAYTLKYFKQVMELMRKVENVKVMKINRIHNPAGVYLEKRLDILRRRFK